MAYAPGKKEKGEGKLTFSYEYIGIDAFSTLHTSLQTVSTMRAFCALGTEEALCPLPCACLSEGQVKVLAAHVQRRNSSERRGEKISQLPFSSTQF